MTTKYKAYFDRSIHSVTLFMKYEGFVFHFMTHKKILLSRS